MSTTIAATRARAVRRSARADGLRGAPLAAAVFGLLVITLDAVVVNVALPAIRRRADRRGGQPAAPARTCNDEGDAMTTWSPQELDRIGAAEELEVAPLREDGSLRPYTTIWVTRVGDELFVRSYRGRTGAWFRAAVRSHEGRIRAGGVARDVTLEQAGSALRDVVDQAYRSKYGRYPQYVSPMLSSEAAATTMRLIPR